MQPSNQRPPYRAGILLGKGFVALTGGVAALLALSCGTGLRSVLDDEPPRAGGKSEAEQITIYDTDPAHLWNRLHSALFVRTASGNKSYGQDELDPPRRFNGCPTITRQRSPPRPLQQVTTWRSRRRRFYPRICSTPTGRGCYLASTWHPRLRCMSRLFTAGRPFLS